RGPFLRGLGRLRPERAAAPAAGDGKRPSGAGFRLSVPSGRGAHRTAGAREQAASRGKDKDIGHERARVAEPAGGEYGKDEEGRGSGGERGVSDGQAGGGGRLRRHH